MTTGAQTQINLGELMNLMITMMIVMMMMKMMSGMMKGISEPEEPPPKRLYPEGPRVGEFYEAPEDNPGITDSAYSAFAKPLLRKRSTRELKIGHAALRVALPVLEVQEFKKLPTYLRPIVWYAIGKCPLLLELMEEEIRSREQVLV